MLLAPDALLVLAGALLLDALIGDPDRIWRRWPHPVVWLGRLVASGDRALNREAWSEGQRRAAGFTGLTLLLAVSAGCAWLGEIALRSLPAGPALVALLASVLLAQRSLHEHARRVETAFAAGGLPAARRAVSMMVGRDPDSLDEAGVSRAAIESVAENFSDGVVAPAFWFAVAGLPGLVVYKAVNTADSMVGHLSDRHRAFGWASARLDDALNLVPARLSGLLIAVAAPVSGGRAGTAFATMRRDARVHRSPNAGWPEAAMAGALGLALAGPRVYASGRVEEPYLNSAGRHDARPGDIGRALRVMALACALHGALYVALARLVALA